MSRTELTPSKQRLRLWLKLLRLTRGVEADLRERLRVEYGATLPRFDVMAALHRRREGVTMSELSRMLLVSNGNATAVVDRLEGEGLVRKVANRSYVVTVHVALTAEGLKAFETMAEGHEAEVARLFAGITDEELDQLTAILKRMGR